MEATNEQRRAVVEEFHFSEAETQEILSSEYFILLIECGDEHAHFVGITMIQNDTLNSKLWVKTNAPRAKSETFHKLVNTVIAQRYDFAAGKQRETGLPDFKAPQGFTLFQV